MPAASIALPLALRHAIEVGECVLFIGAGIGKHLRTPDGPLPDAAGLSGELKIRFGIDSNSEDLSKISELIQIRGKREELEDFVRKRFANASPDEIIQWFCSKKWRAVFTTNYDRGFERGYELIDKPQQQPTPISSTSELVALDPRFEVPVYHIHGAIFGQSQHIVISQTDYTRFREKRRMLFELLKSEFAKSTILYVGYSNRDPNWYLLLNEIAEEFQPSELPQSFRLAPETMADDAEILRARRVQTIDGDAEQFVAAALTQLDPVAEPDRLKSLESSVPIYLRSEFEKQAAPILRLIASWEYVNEANFADRANTKQFFRGDKATWALVGARIPIERDIEADIYDKILDYLTRETEKPEGLIVLGPAGYGISTVLMNVAARLVREHVKPIYYLRPGARILEGDIEFAIKVASGSAVCFVVDDVADHADEFQDVLARLRDEKKSALFLCGSRLNEWRQRRVKVYTKEVQLDSLSSEEIDRLLDTLAAHHELNKLEPLPRDLQRAVIQEKHGKDLLVVLRESTEDKRFDAILEDEYNNIANDKCKEVYLAACCFHLHGAYVRDALLAAICDVPYTDFYTAIANCLDGIVLQECIDETSGLYAFRTRHRKIAEIVWDRCGERAEKDRLLQSGLGHLNLTYAADANAFEKLIRNDWLIDRIRSLDAKILFFDTACRKDPDSPYVRQHYARMLYRADRYELALSQVNEGIELSRNAPPRVLVHTKGTILGALALSADNLDIGRRRLIQAEDAFRHALRMNRRDDYIYQALATLYLDWARHTPDDDESARYLARAEELIGDGLKECKQKDALWIVSAEIEKYLGDKPAQLNALETAVRASPGGTIGRYMLGKAYRRLGRYDDALEVLRPNITNHPNEFRSSIEYALAMLDKGLSLREAIAVVEISSTSGLSDPRYVAHLGGLYFLNKQFSKAAEIFEESNKREFPPEELRQVLYRPRNADGSSLEFRGRVVKRTPTYSMIEHEGYPLFFAHASQYPGVTLREGRSVSFDVGFSPRGQAAVNPRVV